MALRNRKLPRHILVIRNSAMGDVAMVPHALRALREAYPDVRVTVLTRPLFKPFFAGLDVDFLEADYAGRHKGLRGLLRLAGEARRRGIDAVADVHGVLRSRIVGLLLRLHGMPAARIDKGRIEKWFRLYVTIIIHLVLIIKKQSKMKKVNWKTITNLRNSYDSLNLSQSCIDRILVRSRYLDVTLFVLGIRSRRNGT